MAVVSHLALSSEWNFPSPLNPFDVPAFGPHIDLTDHTTAISAVHQLQVTNKRRAHEIEWDDEDVVDRVESRGKKIKTSANNTVDPQQLQGNNSGSHFTLSNAQSVSNTPSPQFEQVISILIDAFTSSNTAPPQSQRTKISNSQADPETTVSISSHVPITSPFSISRPAPTSPLSECPNRAPFIRKTIGGCCAGKTEGSLSRWVLCRNHFLKVRSLDPTTQSSEWVHTLHEMGWEELHPFYQAQAAAQDAQTLGALSAFSRWIEDEFDYDGTEDCDNEWSDEEEEDGEMSDDLREENGAGQRAVWDSGVVLQLPVKSL